MFGAIMLLITTIAFAMGPFIVPDFNGFAADLFPIPQSQPPVQPAGWAFAIWGLIYLWLVISAVFGLLFRAKDEGWIEMRPTLILSTAFGAAWLPIAQGQPLVAAGMIWVMLFTAIDALFNSPRQDRLTASWAIGLYAGWLSAAASVSAAICLAGYDLMTDVTAAQVMIGFAIVLAAGVQLALRRAPTYGLAVVWALCAVVVINQQRHPEIAALAAVGAIALGALVLFALVRDFRDGDLPVV